MVASGHEAQRLAGELQPDVVLLDIDLPDESGWLSAAKILLQQPNQKLILLAGDLTDQLRERAQSVGASGIIARGERVDELVFDRQISVAV